AGTTSRAPGKRAESASRRAAVKSAYGARSGRASGRGAQPDQMKLRKASDDGRSERLEPRSAIDWSSGVVWAGVVSELIVILGSWCCASSHRPTVRAVWKRTVRCAHRPPHPLDGVRRDTDPVRAG